MCAQMLQQLIDADEEQQQQMQPQRDEATTLWLELIEDGEATDHATGMWSIAQGNASWTQPRGFAAQTDVTEAGHKDNAESNEAEVVTDSCRGEGEERRRISDTVEQSFPPSLTHPIACWA